VLTFLADVIPLAVVGLFLLSLGMPSSQVSTQARGLGSVSPEQSGRANTVFMASTFFGGALATALGGVAYGSGGYPAVGAMATVLAIAALTCALVARRRGMFRTA
jgi:predicted MFS family arabinose efflux permease